MRKMFGGLAALLLVLGLTGVASAGPVVTWTGVYENGNECPIDASGPFDGSGTYTRQYTVDPALRCMYITETSGLSANPTGKQIEANNMLNTPEAIAAGWGPANWIGIGSDAQTGGLDGFDFTSENGGRNGTLTISDPLASLYNQFAVAVKDGTAPKFAIFELPVDVFFAEWAFLSEGGNLSHFALYGRSAGTPTQFCGDGVTPPPCDVIAEAPEPASMVLLGTGLVAGAARLRKRIHSVKDAQA